MKIDVIPRPAVIREAGNHFQLDNATTLSFDNRSVGIACVLRRSLGSATGFTLPNADAAKAHSNTIDLRVEEHLGPSAYSLHVSEEGVRILGGDLAGVFHGTQTLLQLCPPQIFRRAPARDVVWHLPGVEISDSPRFAWRGMLLDVSRHFFGVEAVLKLIDLLALHRMNVLHLHLTDDQGWRLEIKRYPRLTDIGSWRARSMVGSAREAERMGAKYDETPHSGFFTQDDVREIVSYASARFITVVPEIDLPGHSQAAIASYPWLGNTDARLEVGTDWGIIPHVLNANDETVAFYQGVLEEVLDLFPSRFVHIGGDECPKGEWKASAAAQAKIGALGLRNEDDLQGWVVRQMHEFLATRGRRLVGWDEILEGGIPPGAAVMSWRGDEGGIAAARAGHDVVMTPDKYTYLYHYQSHDSSAEPPGIDPVLDLRTVYEYEPVPSELSAAEAAHVLGAQCQMWTEFVVSPRQMQQMIFPRLCAFSEVAWTETRRPFEDFKRRLRTHIERLKVMDVAVFEPHSGLKTPNELLGSTT